jgi:hypothetical protein
VKIGVALKGADVHTRTATYLNDHLAGATGAIELARRSLSSNKGNPFGEGLEWFLGQIEEDAEILRDVMSRLDVEEDRLKTAAAWTAEKAGRLKLNGQLVGYSPLSRLVEFEGLMLGVSGKIALWRALERALPEDPRLTGIDFGDLIERAREQRRRLEELRLVAAVGALRDP